MAKADSKANRGRPQTEWGGQSGGPAPDGGNAQDFVIAYDEDTLGSERIVGHGHTG